MEQSAGVASRALEQFMLALREEAALLVDVEEGEKPDRVDVMIAAAFEGLAENIENRLFEMPSGL